MLVRASSRELIASSRKRGLPPSSLGYRGNLYALGKRLTALANPDGTLILGAG